MKLVAISGSGRSGSTLLSIMLSQGEEAFNLGSLGMLWRACAADAPCSCGAGLRDCRVYGPLLHEMFSPDGSGLTPDLMARRCAAFLKSVNRIADWGDVEARSRLREEHAGFLHPLGAFLEALAETTGARVLIENSGVPGMALAFDLIDEVDMRLLNLLRDPRAVAFSSYRRNPALSAAWAELRRWRSRQRRLEHWRHGLGARHMALRHEDIVARPRDMLANALQWAGLTMPPGLFKQPDRIVISWERQHLREATGVGLPAGQPSQLVIAPDDDGGDPRNAALRLLAVAATWPDMRRHYPRGEAETNRLPRE